MPASTTYVETQCSQHSPDLIKSTSGNAMSTLQTDTINSFKKQDIVAAYRRVKDVVLRAGFGEEVSWQASIDFSNISESDFLREHAWVTLSAGMKERVIRNLFHPISSSFYYWESAKIIVENESHCRNSALRHFNNIHKINAIIVTAKDISSKGFTLFKAGIHLDPLNMLQSLPYIGPVTCYHLAKNIGLQVAKPDRHLTRLARSVGYGDVQWFCKDISSQTGDSIPVLDIVLWRFASITPGYLAFFLDAVTDRKA